MSAISTSYDANETITAHSGTAYRISRPVWFGEPDSQSHYIIRQTYNGQEWIVNEYGEWIGDYAGYVCPQSLTDNT